MRTLCDTFELKAGVLYNGAHHIIFQGHMLSIGQQDTTTNKV